MESCSSHAWACHRPVPFTDRAGVSPQVVPLVDQPLRVGYARYYLSSHSHCLLTLPLLLSVLSLLTLHPLLLLLSHNADCTAWHPDTKLKGYTKRWFGRCLTLVVFEWRARAQSWKSMLKAGVYMKNVSLSAAWLQWLKVAVK